MSVGVRESLGGYSMKMLQGLLVVAGLMVAGVAHADPTPSNAELFQMLKAQQETISALRAEIKQMKQEQGAVATAPKQTGSATSGQAVAVTTTAPAQSPVMYTEGAAVAPTAQGRGAYAGLFGGVGRGGDRSVGQSGTVFIIEAAGGPLAVDANGQTNSDNVSFFGGQLGYEWLYHSRLGIDLLPAIEIEGLYMPGTDQHATLQNPNLRLAEQTFDDTFSMDTTVILANAVVGFRTPYQSITPYVGGGVGAALISVDDATSTQTNPVEPGINHFGFSSDSAALAFAA